METNYDFSYFKNLADKQYIEALFNIQRLINHVNERNGNNKQIAKKTNQFIFWCLNEFKNDEMNLYTLTKESIYDSNPTRFLENLHSFVINSIYDDYFFIVEYHDYPDEYYQEKDYIKRFDKFGFNKNYIRQVNGVFDYNDEITHNWEPLLISVGDDNPNFTQNPDYILSAIKFMEDKDKYWKEKYKKLGMERN